jgi:hypothetical protein
MPNVQNGNPTLRSNLDFALYYADHGWSVLPVNGITDDGGCTCGRLDCDRAGKHPYSRMVRTGVKEASDAHAKVSGWFKRFPSLNVGVACGPSEIVVIDVDKEGFEAASELKRDVPELALTLRQKTGSGGFHFVFDANGETYGNAPLSPGIDVRGAGGYIVAASSRHASGGRYEWVKQPIRSVPDALRQRLESARQGASCDCLTEAKEIPYGVQHNVLISLLGRLRSFGLTEKEMLAVALEVSEGRFEKPMTDRQVVQRVKSVARYDVGTFNIDELVDEELRKRSLLEENSY